MKLNFAKRMSYIKASEIREILKVTEQEDVISFAGGLPAPELFPIDEINEINQIVLKEAGTKALQYTTTEGYAPLREWIANRMNERLGTAFDKDNIPTAHNRDWTYPEKFFWTREISYFAKAQHIWLQSARSKRMDVALLKFPRMRTV